jgi:hypothetical protein
MPRGAGEGAVLARAPTWKRKAGYSRLSKTGEYERIVAIEPATVHTYRVTLAGGKSFLADPGAIVYVEGKE